MIGNFELIQFNGRGKCIMSLEGMGSAMLKLWALQNTNGKKLTIIRDFASKEIIYVAQGMGKDFPKITADRKKIDAMAIELEVI